MDLQNWSEIPTNKLGEFDYGVKHDDDAGVAVGYTHADPGYVVWTTEGKLHEGGPEARLGFHSDEDDAREHVHDYAADHADVKKARQAVRGTGDAAKGVADPDGMDESLPWSAFGGGRSVRRAVENAFSSAEELAEASDAHLRSFEGVGPTTVENLRSWLAEEGYADEDPNAPDPDTAGDLDLDVDPSGLDLDDPATEITGVGDSSNLARETVGDFWDMGCPFHEVAGAWQEEALHDILGASFFINTQPDHLIRVFAGYTAAYAYNEEGEEIGNFPEGMFGMFDWSEVRWAWADHGLSTSFGDVAAADEVIEHQGAVATGDELPFERLDFDPEEDHGLSGLHGTRTVDAWYPDSGGVWFEYEADVDAEESEVYVPKATVQLYSLLFMADFSDPSVAEEHLYLVADTDTSAESKRRTLDHEHQDNRYVAVFNHPSADVYGIAEGQISVAPSDFDLTEPSEYGAWAEQVAQQIEERREAFEREMERGPNSLRETRGVAPDRQLDDAVGAHPHNDYRNADREDPNEQDHFEEQMAGIYDPTEDVADDGDKWEGHDVLRSDEPETVYQADLDKTEQATPDEYGVLTDDDGQGYGTQGWQIIDPDVEADVEAAKKAGVYDPTDEFEDLEEPSEISGIGEGRRKTLDALDEKDQLDDPQSFDSLEEMKNAVREISLAHRDGRTYMAPPQKALDAIQSTWDSLPEEARDEFLNDHRLYVKIRAARNRFNDWMGKKRREQQIPSTMEAGPSNYPTKKAKKTAQYARDGKEELDEAIDKIRSAANGAKQRALKSIGSSVGEQNEQQRQEKRDQRRDEFEKGDLAFYSTTTYGNALWGVKRVNKKSVRLRRPHGSAGMEKPMSDGETYPEYDETRADLDSSRLKGPIPAQEVAEFSVEDTDARTSDDSIAVRADTAAEARRIVFGDEWVEDNLDLDDGTDEQDDTDTGGTEDMGTNFVREHAAQESKDVADRLRDEGLNNIVASNLAREFDSYESVRQAVKSAEASGTVTDLPGVGDATASQVRALFTDDGDQDPGDDQPTPTGDRAAAEEHRKAVQAAREADPDGDLPGPALAALKKNWSVYKRGIKEGREAAEEVEQYRDDHRADAEEAAAIINDIRDAYGQEPIDFEGVEGIPQVDELGGPITADDPGVSLSFDWTADPYDPTGEV